MAWLSFIKCPMNYGWRFVTLYRRQGSRPFPRKRNAKKQNDCLRRLTNSCEKKEKQKSKGEKERYTHLNSEFQRIARRIRKSSSAINRKK